ncbi:MAG: hypothetical protein ABEI74_01175 [Candidatus Pacearchaeota archaeon]
MKVPKINHQFKDGIYQYSEIMPKSSLMNYFNASEGMSLYKPISFGKVEQARKAYQDARANKDYQKAFAVLKPESERLQSEFRKALEFIDPIKVIWTDFKVEEPVAEELRNSDNSLVKTLINVKYL